MGIKRPQETGPARSIPPASRPDGGGDRIRTIGTIRLDNDLPGKHRSFEAGKSTSRQQAIDLAIAIANGTSPFPWASARAVKIEVIFHPKGSSRLVKSARKKGEKRAAKKRIVAEDDFYTTVVTGPLDAATDSDMTNEIVYNNLDIDFFEE